MAIDAFRIWRRVALATSLVATMTLQACACLQSDGPIANYHFEVLRPRALVIYKPVAGTPPANDIAIIYLALQNDSEGPRSLCFACYRHSDKSWHRVLFSDVVPSVEVTSENAPIIGVPEVRLAGASGETVKPGRRFPDIIPDASEFPLNEANYRRDFAIVVHPDRTRVGVTGDLLVRVSLARPNHPRPDDGQPQIASFRIPVTISKEFRPETMTTEPSQP
ncbi:hypothetical protein ACN9M1_05935 [Ralstonia sp. R-29]|uniref:hypothetical protein n=1 Tax=Ralstonia sp. R-29 TaxID=3404059 RepID=UPI003CF501F9